MHSDDPTAAGQSAALPLWPLALAAGLLPAVAALAAWQLSTRLELIAACNPFIDGCVSISRAARHDLPNHLFGAIVLPAAVLQGLTWWLAAVWLRELALLAPAPAGRHRRGRGVQFAALWAQGKSSVQ